MGYVRTRSTPSLVAGIGLGVSYAYAGRLALYSLTTALLRRGRRCWPASYSLSPGYLIKQNRDYGTELALGNSALLTASAIPRIIKTGGRAPVPLALGSVGLLASYYYTRKVQEFRYGV